MKKLIFVCLASTFLLHVSFAQLGDILKRKAGEGARQGAEYGTEKAIDKGIDKIFSKKGKNKYAHPWYTQIHWPAHAHSHTNGHSWDDNTHPAQIQAVGCNIASTMDRRHYQATQSLRLISLAKTMV